MRIVIALGILAGAGFIWMSINEMAYRKRWFK